MQPAAANEHFSGHIVRQRGAEESTAFAASSAVPNRPRGQAVLTASNVFACTPTAMCVPLHLDARSLPGYGLD